MSPQIFYPPKAERASLKITALLVTLSLLVVAIMFWTTGSAAKQGEMTGAVIGSIVCSLLAVWMGVLLAWQLSLRVELDETQIVRRSMFGFQSMELIEIESAMFSGYEGETILELRAKKRHLNIGTNAFSLAQLHQIREFLIEQARLSSRALQAEPPLLTQQEFFRTGAILQLIVLLGMISFAMYLILRR